MLLKVDTLLQGFVKEPWLANLINQNPFTKKKYNRQDRRSFPSSVTLNFRFVKLPMSKLKSIGICWENRKVFVLLFQPTAKPVS